jgi:two-component sensor histidine kinase
VINYTAMAVPGGSSGVTPDRSAEYQSLIDSFPSGAWSVDREYRLIVWNRAAEAVFRGKYGIEPEPYLELLSAFDGETRRRWRRRYDRAMAGESFLDEEEAEFAGESLVFELRISPVYREGKVAGALVVSGDVTGERLEKERSEAYSRRFRYMSELTAELSNEVQDLDALYAKILDYLGRTIDLVSASVQLLEEDQLRIVAFRGFLEEEVVKKLRFPLRPPFPNARVVLERRSIAMDDIRQAAPHFKDDAQQYQSGHIRSWLGVPMLVGDTVVGVITVDRGEVRPFTKEEVELVTAFASHVAAAINNARLYRDIAEAAETREFLLRELYHRVKNNMQLVSSILSLQGGAIEDARAAKVLRELQIRVRSLGLVHEALHQAEEVGLIELGPYIRSVVNSVLSEYALESPLLPRFALDSVRVGVDLSVPLGLIVGEMVLNAVKHAYREGERGPLLVELAVDGCDGSLTIADTGVGLPESIDITAPESFGINLLWALSQQIKGSLTVERSGGTSWRLRFPLGPALGCESG